jgi:RNA-directed DNA polymerase
MSAAATPTGAAPHAAPGWHSINWRKVWRNVRRLQARIVKAAQAGRWNKVQALVYLLTHSQAGRAAAILRVIDNRGACTPGVDGIEKTRITRVENGFDFLGQQVRRYGNKVLLKPSTKNVRALLDKVDKVLQGEGGHLPVGLLIEQLNLILRGWALYHRHASSTRTFARVDHLIFGKLWRWARRRHSTKPAHWVKAKYFTQRGQDQWVFHGKAVDGMGRLRPVYLYKTAQTGIRRHVQVREMANPYDPAWEVYFEERLSTKMADDLSGRRAAQTLWAQQGGQCPVCGQGLTLEERWHMHHLQWQVYGGSDAL